jgi:glyoxalase family protein
MPVLGLHHVTATVDDAQDDLDFCLTGLGLRLVKKTVNFDNHFVYHFYYGDERGTPGTIWTTFPYKGHGVRTGSKGVGQVTVTSFSVPTGAFQFWRTRLANRGVAVTDAERRFGDPAVRFSDLSGLDFELVASDVDAREPWVAEGFDRESAIRGLYGVTILVRDPRPTIDLMTGLLGFEIVAEEGRRIRLAAGGASPGHFVDVAHDREAAPMVNGVGTVHHVAMAIDSEAEQLRMRETLLQHGARVTEVRDRTYFKSIYFREPGGVLFELATMHPGFTFDEPLTRLGRDLKLPGWEEPHRAEIEARLEPVEH